MRPNPYFNNGSSSMNFDTQDPNIFWDLLKKEISRKSFMKILVIKIYEDFYQDFFPLKNLHKIYLDFLQKNFKQFLPKIFLRSLKNLLEIVERSSFYIFCSFIEDHFLKWSEDLLMHFKKLFSKSASTMSFISLALI